MAALATSSTAERADAVLGDPDYTHHTGFRSQRKPNSPPAPNPRSNMLAGSGTDDESLQVSQVFLWCIGSV